MKVAHVFRQDNYDVDQIIGVQNIRLQDPVALGQLALERLGVEFARRVQPGDIVAGRRNFGFGHPHVQATIALRQTGIQGVIADSFTPSFWRGAMSMGFLLVACRGIEAAVEPGDELHLDWATSTTHIARSGLVLPFQPHTAFERQLLRAGGIVPLLAQARPTQDLP